MFAQPGVPRDPFEKLEDAAQVHAFTGVAPKVSLHIPWDRVDDYAALNRHAADIGVRIGTINSNVFQDDDFRLGSVTHPDPMVRGPVRVAPSRAESDLVRTGPDQPELDRGAGADGPAASCVCLVPGGR
ncbi:hypothetical protein AMK22_29720 [Streptomyces sp. CB01580]|nr:hypothetical protein AMK22_29720 [Streptomyces sp. CB01580]